MAMRVLGHRAAVVIGRQRAVVLDADIQIARGRGVAIRHQDRHPHIQSVFDTRIRMIDRRQQFYVVRIETIMVVVQRDLDHVLANQFAAHPACQRLAVAGQHPMHSLVVRGQGFGRRTQLHRQHIARVRIVDRERAAVRGAVGRVRGAGAIRNAIAMRRQREREQSPSQPFFRDRRVRVGAVVATEGDRRHVVRALDDDRQGCRRGIAVRIGQRIGENIIGGLVLPQGLHGGMALVGRIADQGIGVGAIFIQDQVAIGAMNDGAHATADVRAQAVAGLDSRYGGRVDAQRIGIVSGPGIARFAIALDDVPHGDQGGILGHVGRVGDGGRRRIRDGRDDVADDGTAQAIDHGDADGIGQVLPDGRVRGRARVILPAVGHVAIGDRACVLVVAGQGQDAPIRIDDDGRARRRRDEFGQGHRQGSGRGRGIAAGRAGFAREIEHQGGQAGRRRKGKDSLDTRGCVGFADVEGARHDRRILAVTARIVITIRDVQRRPRRNQWSRIVRYGGDAAQLHEFRRLHARARVGQAQGRSGFRDAGQAREAVAAATAAGQHRRGRIQDGERVLARIQRGQHLVDHRVGRGRHGVVRRLRLRRGQVVGDQHVGVLAHDHRRHAGGLQGHAGALVRHDVRVDGHAHAFVQGDHRAVGCAHPSLAGDMGDQDGIGSHGGVPSGEFGGAGRRGKRAATAIMCRDTTRVAVDFVLAEKTTNIKKPPRENTEGSLMARQKNPAVAGWGGLRGSRRSHGYDRAAVLWRGRPEHGNICERTRADGRLVPARRTA